MCMEIKIWLVTWSNPIKPEGLYGRFDHVTTRFISPYTSKNGILFVKYFLNLIHFAQYTLPRRTGTLYAGHAQWQALWLSSDGHFIIWFRHLIGWCTVILIWRPLRIKVLEVYWVCWTVHTYWIHWKWMKTYTITI